MAYNHEYPYVDPNRYNSDWILNKIKELMHEMDTFEALNKITFSGEWDITKQYPAWTIVNDNNGRDGYISIRPVPAGITIDNADYWRGVANYSDLIADLQNRMIAAEGAIDQLEDDVDQLEDDVDQLENDVDQLRYQTGMKSPRKCIFIGDSFGQTSPNWQTEVRTFLGITDYVDSFVGGEGFMPSSGTNGFLNQLNAVYASHTDPDGVTDIIVVGGTNDIELDHITDLENAVYNFCVAAHTNFKNARVHIAFAGTKYRASDLTGGLTEYRALADYYYQRGCAHGNAHYIGGIRKALSWMYRLQSDHVHPSTAGTHVIATIVGAAIVDGVNMDVPSFDMFAKGTVDNTQIQGTWECLAGRDLNKFTLKWGAQMKVSINDNQYHTLIPYNDLPVVPQINSGNRIIRNVRISGVWYKCMFIMSASGLELIIINSGQTVPSGNATFVEDIEFTF